MGAAPVIIAVSDLRQDVAGVIRVATASGEPVYVTQRGRTTAVVLSRLSYERLWREHEILCRAAVGTLGASPDGEPTLEEILARGERVLAEERQAAADERLAAGRRLGGALEVLRPPERLTDEEFLISEGYGYLVRGSASAVAPGGEEAAACPEHPVWLGSAGAE